MDKEDNIWSEGSYIENINPNDPKFQEKMKYFDENKNEEKNFECKICKAKIGKHNLYWHEGMCNNCFFDKYNM